MVILYTIDLILLVVFKKKHVFYFLIQFYVTHTGICKHQNFIVIQFVTAFF